MVNSPGRLPSAPAPTIPYLHDKQSSSYHYHPGSTYATSRRGTRSKGFPGNIKAYVCGNQKHELFAQIWTKRPCRFLMFLNFTWYICFLDGSFSLRVLFGNNTHRIPKLRGKGQTQTVMFRLSNQSRIISWPLPLSSTSLLSFLPVGNNYLLNGHCLFFINNSVCFSMKFVIYVILHIFYHPFILRHLTSVRDPYFTWWLQIGCHIASKFSWGEQPLWSSH